MDRELHGPRVTFAFGQQRAISANNLRQYEGSDCVAALRVSPRAKPASKCTAQKLQANTAIEWNGLLLP
jgi:hypothetical protein